jgi:hypothetical protein
MPPRVDGIFLRLSTANAAFKTELGQRQRETARLMLSLPASQFETARVSGTMAGDGALVFCVTRAGAC